MSQKGNVLVQVIVMLFVVVLTSFGLLLLIKTEVITVSTGNDVSVLDFEFLPFGREDFLVVKEFQFCLDVDAQFNCLNQQEIFQLGDKVYFRFLVESTVYEGGVMIIENYRLKDPQGQILLDVDAKDNYYFETTSRKQVEEIVFQDYFVIFKDNPRGIYTLELVLENPLIQKKVTVVKQFSLV